MLRGIEIFVNVIGWLQIVGAAFFLSIGIGFILYYAFPTDIVYVFAVLISILGLLIGVI